MEEKQITPDTRRGREEPAADSRATPDVRELAKESLPETKFPGGGRQDFRVSFDEEVHGRIVAHAAESKSVEICGVLVGGWERDADGPFVVVSGAIRCDAAASRTGEVTFTHEAWNAINREMDTRYTDRKIVGWYHSHPGFGIFLSDRDGFIHQHFFGNPGQVAFVVDPLAETEGVFAWRDGKPAACPHYWVGKEVRVSDRGGSGDALRLSVPPGTAPAPPPPDAGLPLTWSGALRAALPYVLVFLIAWLLRGLQTDWERQRLVEGTVAHFGLWKGLRPGLEECLSGAEGDLQRISQRVGRLAKEHVELAGDGAAEKKQEWNDVQQALAQVGHFLGTVNRRYGFTPEERAAIEKYLLVKQAELQGLRVETKETPPSKPETPPKPEGPPKLDKPGKLDVPKPAAGEKTSTKPAPPAKTPEKK